jgi:hypothetical protein
LRPTELSDAELMVNKVLHELWHTFHDKTSPFQRDLKNADLRFDVRRDRKELKHNNYIAVFGCIIHDWNVLIPEF